VACKLSGTDLYLLDSVSADPQFRTAVQVPDGFPGSTLPVPHPQSGDLYVRLRDDPAIVNAANLETQVLPPPPAATPAVPTAESSRAAAPDGAPVVAAASPSSTH
jgi:hypothetical protein